jgi:hypothetical protein
MTGQGLGHSNEDKVRPLQMININYPGADSDHQDEFEYHEGIGKGFISSDEKWRMMMRRRMMRRVQRNIDDVNSLSSSLAFHMNHWVYWHYSDR